MNKIPTWVKVLAALAVLGAMFGGSQILLKMDKTASGKAGIE